jgi:hypothetical protein
MSPRSGLRNEPGLAEATRHQPLPDGVVDLVRPRMQQVLALEIDARPPQVLRESLRMVERRRTAGVLGQPVSKLPREGRVAAKTLPRLLQLEQRRHERLRDVATAVVAEVPRRVRQLSRVG